MSKLMESASPKTVVNPDTVAVHPMGEERNKIREKAELKEAQREMDARADNLAQHMNAQARLASKELAKAQTISSSKVPAGLGDFYANLQEKARLAEDAKKLADEAYDYSVNRRVAQRRNEEHPWMNQYVSSEEGPETPSALVAMYQEIGESRGSSDVMGGTLDQVSLDGSGIVGAGELLAEVPGLVKAGSEAVWEFVKEAQGAGKDDMHRYVAKYNFKIGNEIREDDYLDKNLSQNSLGFPVLIPYVKGPEKLEQKPASLPDPRVAETPQLKGSKSSEAAWTAIEQNAKRREIPNFTPAVEGVEVCEPDETLMSVDPSLTPVAAPSMRVS